MTRREKMLELRKLHRTYEEIGRIFVISKERVRQILNSTEKPDLDSKTMLRVSEVAQLLGLHVNTVRRWSKKGILPRSYRICSRGDRRFRREDIERFLEKRGG